MSSEQRQITRFPVIRGLRFAEYASAVPPGEYWSRQDFAEHFGVRYSTAQYHADRAVEQGLLERAYGFVDNQPGYLYFKPSGEEQ